MPPFAKRLYRYTVQNRKVTKEYSSIIRKQKMREENENRKCKQFT